MRPARPPRHRPAGPLLAGAALGAVLALLAGCGFYPSPVLGVPAGEPWFTLPLGRWLAEDRAEPEAMAICRQPDCGPAMVVSVVRFTGSEADRAEAVLRTPEALARALQLQKDKAPVRTIATARRIQDGPFRGFALSLARRDGTHTAYGMALGRRDGDALRVLLVIGEDPDAVDATARKVATAHLGS